MLRSNSLAIRVRWVIAARKGRAQVAQRVAVGPGGSWRPGVRVIAKQFGVDPGTVQRISRPFAAASVVVPPKIFSKEVAQNRPPHLPRQQPPSARNRFTPNFQGWGLDENLKLKKSPYRGSHYRGSTARQNEVGLAARAAASCRAPAPAPPSYMLHAAAPPFTTVQKMCTAASLLTAGVMRI